MAYKILETIGYYHIKKKVKHRLFCLKLQREDARRKKQVRNAVSILQGSQLIRSNNRPDIIVSLTSYGVRINDTLPYALYSLLQQTRQPDRIVVWLDNINWNKESLPPIFRKFEEFGVEFFFVEDIRSYKKLIPALKMFPDSVIITVDDDMYYNPRTVEWLTNAYLESDKQTVFGTWAYQPKIQGGGYLPYSSWKNSDDRSANNEFSLIGCGGILYPPHVFDGEILKEELFMKMAPTADDLWFWAMEKRQGIPVKLIPNARQGLHEAVDRIDVWKPEREGSLYFINEVNGENDIQLERLVSYYGIRP